MQNIPLNMSISNTISYNIGCLNERQNDKNPTGDDLLAWKWEPRPTKTVIKWM